jgi:hypothetical protein
MRKSKEQVKRFLSSFPLKDEREATLIQVYLSNRKTKITPSTLTVSERNGSEEGHTFDQFESWYKADMPTVGDVVKCEQTGAVGIVTREGWDHFGVSAILTADHTLHFKDYRFSNEKWAMASEEEILALQRALAGAGKDWSPISLSLVERNVPDAPKYVRLTVLGKQVGIGIFRRVMPDHTLLMFCVKMGGGRLRFSDDINLGDVDSFSFLDTYDEHRAVIQEELCANGLLWNPKLHRLQKNNARLKVGESYFWITSYLEIKCAIEKNSYSDDRRFNVGNYFPKREVAERVRCRGTIACKEEMMTDYNKHN